MAPTPSVDYTTLRKQPCCVPVQTIKVEIVAGLDHARPGVDASENLTIGTAEGNDLVLSDPTVSRFHLELSRRSEGVLVADQGSTNGTFHRGVRIERAVVPPGTTIELGSTSVKISDGTSVGVELHPDGELCGLLGDTPLMRRLMHQLRKVAATEAGILVIGESGTGKELLARAIHELGPRASRPLVTVDCASLTPTLVGSALFGHERGSFTGAHTQHVGAFEQADGGTLFLDEIGDLPEGVQATLLGALERRRFRRVGGRTDVPVDVRVVAATHRDLRAEVNAGSFRLDLFYRLAVVVLRVPPLRDRVDDIPLLLSHFLRECGFSGTVEEVFPPMVVETLRRYRWPGNVRELRNLVEATIAIGESPLLDEVHGARNASGTAVSPDGELLALPYKDARQRILTEFEQSYLKKLLERSGASLAIAARKAGIDRTHLSNLLRRHGLRGSRQVD